MFAPSVGTMMNGEHAFATSGGTAWRRRQRRLRAFRRFVLWHSKMEVAAAQFSSTAVEPIAPRVGGISCCSWPGDRSGYSWGCRFSSSCWRVYWAWVQSNSPWTLCCSPCCHRVLPDVRWRRWCAVCWVAAGSALWAPVTGAGAAAHRGAGSRDFCARSGPRCSCAADGGGTGGRILSEVRRACGCRAGYRCAEDLAGHGSASYGGLFTSDADGGTVGGSADCRDLRS